MKGFTLIEVMVTLVIAGILLFSATLYLTGVLPKQRLNTQATKLRNFLVMAQEKAKDRQETYCLTISTTLPLTFSIYRNGDEDNACASAGDTLTDRLILDSSISFPTSPSTCAAASAYWTGNYALFFTGSGQMEARNSTITTLTYPTYELILSSNQIDSTGQRAREVEVSTMLGRIDLVPVGKTGTARRIALPAPPGYVNAISKPLYCQ